MNFQVDLAVFLVRIFELKLLWSWSRLYRKFSWTSKDLQNFISIQRAAPKIQLVLFRNIFYEIINPYLYKYKYSRHSQAYLESPYQEKFLWFYDKPFWAVPRIFFPQTVQQFRMKEHLRQYTKAIQNTATWRWATTNK